MDGQHNNSQRVYLQRPSINQTPLVRSERLVISHPFAHQRSFAKATAIILPSRCSTSCPAPSIRKLSTGAGLLLCAALTGCASTPATLYLDTGLRYADAGVQIERTDTTHLMTERLGFVSYVGAERSTSVHHVALNPYGTLGLTLEIELSPALLLAIDVDHESSIASRTDRGVNSLGVSLRRKLWSSRQ